VLSLACKNETVEDTARNWLLRAEGLLPATHSTATALSAFARATGSFSTRRQWHPANNRHLP